MQAAATALETVSMQAPAATIEAAINPIIKQIYWIQ